MSAAPNMSSAPSIERQARIRMLFLNLGHLIDHLLMLVFATAVLGMTAEFGRGYESLLPLATPAFILFGLAAIPAGWIADRWSRSAMMTVFFIGIGTASVLTALSQTTFQLALGLALIGVFAAIYHPVGIAMVSIGAGDRLGRRLGVNGVFGNMGVAAAPLLAGALTAWIDWRAAFVVPGVFSILIGIAFWVRERAGVPIDGPVEKRAGARMGFIPGWQRALGALALITLIGGFVFNVTTNVLPKAFDEGLPEQAGGLAAVGTLVAIIYALAAFAQIIVGHAIDRWSIRPILLTIAGLQIPAMIWVATAEGWSLIIAAGVMMSLVFGQIPIGDTLVARYSPDALRARVYAVNYVLNFSVASTALPVIALAYGGAGGGGTVILFTGLGLAAGMVTLAALLLPRRRMAQPAMSGA